MKTVPAGKFKAQCLAIMDEVKLKRTSVVITKHGKPVAKLVPVSHKDKDEDEGKKKDEIFGYLKGKATVVGDIVSPILSPEEWGDSY